MTCVPLIHVIAGVVVDVGIFAQPTRLSEPRSAVLWLNQIKTGPNWQLAYRGASDTSGYETYPCSSATNLIGCPGTTSRCTRVPASYGVPYPDSTYGVRCFRSDAEHFVQQTTGTDHYVYKPVAAQAGSEFIAILPANYMNKNNGAISILNQPVLPAAPEQLGQDNGLGQVGIRWALPEIACWAAVKSGLWRICSNAIAIAAFDEATHAHWSGPAVHPWWPPFGTTFTAQNGQTGTLHSSANTSAVKALLEVPCRQALYGGT